MKITLSLLIIFTVSLTFPTHAQIFNFACTDKQPSTEKDFKTWIKKDVFHLIRASEKKDFLTLRTAQEQNEFIKKFWERRDNVIKTKKNEFRETYCQRVLETHQFEAGMPGWRTDRGKVYLLYGKPKLIEIGLTKYEQTDNVSFEKWTYRFMSGMTLKQEFFFYDTTGTNAFYLMKSNPSVVFMELTNYKDDIFYNN